MSTEAGIETVPVRAEDDDRMKAHIVCSACHPDPDAITMGTPAICGEKVLGIRPEPPYVRCRKCEKARAAHRLSHFVGGRG